MQRKPCRRRGGAPRNHCRYAKKHPRRPYRRVVDDPGETTFPSSQDSNSPTVILNRAVGVRVSQKDRDLLLKIVRVLEVIIEHCQAETRRAFHPLIDSVEFITRAMDRDDEWFSR